MLASLPELAQDAGVAVAGGEQLALLESLGVELGETRVRATMDEVGDVASEGGRQLEPMSAGAGIHEHALRDLADHRLPVRADVVDARPAAARLRVVHERVSAGDCVLQLELFVAPDRLVELVWIDRFSRMRPAHHVLVGSLRAAVIAGDEVAVAEGNARRVGQASGGDDVVFHPQRELDPDLACERRGPWPGSGEQALSLEALPARQPNDGAAPGPQLQLLHRGM